MLRSPAGKAVLDKREPTSSKTKGEPNQISELQVPQTQPSLNQGYPPGTAIPYSKAPA